MLRHRIEMMPMCYTFAAPPTETTPTPTTLTITVGIAPWSLAVKRVTASTQVLLMRARALDVSRSPERAAAAEAESAEAESAEAESAEAESAERVQLHALGKLGSAQSTVRLTLRPVLSTPNRTPGCSVLSSVAYDGGCDGGCDGGGNGGDAHAHSLCIDLAYPIDRAEFQDEARRLPLLRCGRRSCDPLGRLPWRS